MKKIKVLLLLLIVSLLSSFTITYAPKLRTNSSSICASTHSGIWSHY